MTENDYTTIRIAKDDKKRFRGYQAYPKQPDDQVMKWILDKLEEETDG